VECTRINCPMQAGTPTDNCGENCPWRTTAKTGDLISRAAAIEYLMTNMGWHDEDGYEVDDADEKRAIITDLVNGIPAMDAVPVVQGEWVEEPDRVGHYHCSKCGVVWGIAAKAMKYCPNCAAKMINSPIWEVGDAK